jgi:hypothetical protein
MVKKLTQPIYFLIAIMSLAAITSCEKFEGSQTIPSYIHIDSIWLVNNSSIEEGSLTSNIDDAWVYVNDQLIGAFELPATVPILVEGNHKLSVYGGVKYNGMSGTRGPYPFWEAKIVADYDFMIDSVRKFNPATKYYTTTVFTWMEDYEDITSSLQPTINSDTSVQLIYHEPSHPQLGSATGVVYLQGSATTFEGATNVEAPTGITLPRSGSPVFLELDYNTNTHLVIGLLINEPAQTLQHPVVVLNPTDGVWKKIYVNFTPTISKNNSAIDFDVFFRADKPDDLELSVLKFDNIKLVHKDVL